MDGNGLPAQRRRCRICRHWLDEHNYIRLYWRSPFANVGRCDDGCPNGPICSARMPRRGDHDTVSGVL